MITGSHGGKRESTPITQSTSWNQLQKVVREAALRLETEGLISVVLVPTPRGLVLAQKRSGRK